MAIHIQKAIYWRKRDLATPVAIIISIVVVLGLVSPAHAAVAHVATTFGNNGAGNTSIVINKPSTGAGQFMVAAITARVGPAVTAPSGWSTFSGFGVASDANILHTHFWKVSTASEPSSYTFPISTSAKASGVISAYSGVVTASLGDFVGQQQSNASSTTMLTPSYTTTAANSMIVATYGSATGTTFAAGSSMNLRGQDASTSNGATSRTTTGIQDITQAVAGSSGQKTMTASSAATSIGLILVLTPAPIVSQSGYRWFANTTTAGTVGSPLANQDTTATAPAAGQPFRLRMLLGVADVQLPTTTGFKLQYKWESSGTCSATGSYSDVTTSTPIKYFDNTGVSDAASIVTSGSDPVRSGVTKVTQTYEELNNFTVATAVPVGQDGMWDFALTLDTSAYIQGIYCLKAVGSSGTALMTYSAVPGIRALAPASKIAQGGYRFSQNANSLTPGSPLAATNTAATLGASNDAFRLRAAARGYQGFSQITSGSAHTCGIASDNRAYCWGNNSSGQLGNGGAPGDQVSPVAVDTSNALSGKTILSIKAGDTHTCVIASDNLAYCWGDDGTGQVGNGATTGTQVSPVAVDASGVLSGKTILSISAGSAHTCAIASDNLAYCWGDDTAGRLGNGATTGTQVSPVAVDTSGVLSGKTILGIFAGAGHTCAIASDNQAYCWGSDLEGRLGNGATTGNQVSPVAVDTSGVLSGKTILSIFIGSSTCAIASDNQAYCWGSDGNGQVGNGATTGNPVSPVAVDTSGVLSGKTILSISTGATHVCVVASNNLAYCWGNDFNGQLGNGATAGDQVSPVAVDTSGVLSGKTLLSISAGSSHTCAIASDNHAYCWGDDASSQLGNGATTGNQVSPVAVSSGGALSGKTILSMAVGGNHTCAIASDNLAYCWGLNASGQLGNGSITNREDNPVPVDTTGVLSGKTILSITAGNNHTCVIASDNLPYCWGRDAESQLGNGAVTGLQDSPVAVDTTGVLSGKTILSISSGVHHVCVKASDNQAYCWGFDFEGELGNGAPFADQASPVAVDTSGVLSGKTILSIVSGGYHTCAKASDNQLYCWGNDGAGQVGNGATTGNQASPVAIDTSGVLSGKTVTAINPGANHTCVIASDSLIYCWGSDQYGQVGNGATTGDQVSPVAVDTSGVLAGKTILSSTGGGFHTCAIASDNQAYCWGYDQDGELGNGVAFADQVSPVAVDTSGVLAGKTILSIYAGVYHTCAKASDNLAYCWGKDISGQLGNGVVTGNKPTPIAVNLLFSSTYSVPSGQLLLTLQFAQKTLSSCAVQTGFAAVTTSTSIAFNDNGSATSGAAITTSSPNDPVTSGGNIAQTYHDLVDAITNTSDLEDEGSGLWDFSLKDNGAPISTTFCLRLVGSDGSTLGMYQNYPEITTASAPSVDPSKDMLRGGQSVINGIKNLFSW